MKKSLDVLGAKMTTAGMIIAPTFHLPLWQPQPQIRFDFNYMGNLNTLGQNPTRIGAWIVEMDVSAEVSCTLWNVLGGPLISHSERHRVMTSFLK